MKHEKILGTLNIFIVSSFFFVYSSQKCESKHNIMNDKGLSYL